MAIKKERLAGEIVYQLKKGKLDDGADPWPKVKELLKVLDLVDGAEDERSEEMKALKERLKLLGEKLRHERQEMRAGQGEVKELLDLLDEIDALDDERETTKELYRAKLHKLEEKLVELRTGLRQGRLPGMEDA